jgi:hypothetical protein
MAFANEYLTDEAERKKYGKAHVTLDRERDAWLTRSGCAGRSDEAPQFLELHWKSQEIKMHAYETRTGTSKEGLTITWEVAKMHMPNKLESHRSEIIEMVREALIARKCGGLEQHDDLVNNVIVYFSNWIINPVPGEPTWM